MKRILLGLAIVVFIASFAYTATFETVTVGPADNLQTIAQKHLKNPSMANALLQFNGLNSARDIRPGLSLKIPYSISIKRVAKVSFTVGTVEVKEGNAWKAVSLNQVLIQSDIIRTNANGKVNITLDDGTVVKLGPSSQLSLANYAYSQGARNTNLNLTTGSAAMNVTTLTRGSNFNVSSVTAVAGVRGTRFYMGVSEGNDVDLSVYQGSVEVVSKVETSSDSSVAAPAPVIVNSGYATRVSSAGDVVKPFPIPGKIEWADEQ